MDDIPNDIILDVFKYICDNNYFSYVTDIINMSVLFPFIEYRDFGWNENRLILELVLFLIGFADSINLTKIWIPDEKSRLLLTYWNPYLTIETRRNKSYRKNQLERIGY